GPPTPNQQSSPSARSLIMLGRRTTDLYADDNTKPFMYPFSRDLRLAYSIHERSQSAFVNGGMQHVEFERGRHLRVKRREVVQAEEPDPIGRVFHAFLPRFELAKEKKLVDVQERRRTVV